MGQGEAKRRIRNEDKSTDHGHAHDGSPKALQARSRDKEMMRSVVSEGHPSDFLRVDGHAGVTLGKSTREKSMRYINGKVLSPINVVAPVFQMASQKVKIDAEAGLRD